MASSRIVTNKWNEINRALKGLPKFQNKQLPGASDEDIKQLESKLQIKLPKEIREVIKIHNGRKHIEFGLSFRSPTTDLLPISEWKPYEVDNSEFEENLFECLADKNYACANKDLEEDAQEHFKVFREADNKITEKFRSLPCELLIIGQGMDDYAEQYILSIRSGKIYVAVHNIPEWQLIGTFKDWVKKSLACIKQQKRDIKEQHEEIQIE